MPTKIWIHSLSGYPYFEKTRNGKLFRHLVDLIKAAQVPLIPGVEVIALEVIIDGWLATLAVERGVQRKALRNGTISVTIGIQRSLTEEEDANTFVNGLSDHFQEAYLTAFEHLKKKGMIEHIDDYINPILTKIKLFRSEFF